MGAGIAPDELADHATTTLELGPAATLPAPALEAWLVDGELARVDGGLLVPTALAVELGGQLTGST